MRIMLSGGVFGRAEGLWEEIGAALYAENATEAITFANANPQAIPAPVRTIKQRSRAVENQDELLVETV